MNDDQQGLKVKSMKRSNLVWDDVSILLANSHSAEALLTDILRHHDVIPIIHTERRIRFITGITSDKVEHSQNVKIAIFGRSQGGCKC